MDKRQQNSNGRRRVNFISKGNHSAALWAMGLYERLGLRHNIHIRRLHYHALLQEGLTLPSGRTYRNTLADCEYLERAFDQARLLGFVPYDVFSDTSGFADFGPYGSDTARRQLLKQKIDQACKRHMRNMLACLAPVHIEIWLEKNTAADIFYPLGEKYRLNIVTNQNEIPLTSIWHFLRRIANISKPVRIMYISDFTPEVLNTAADKVTAIMSQYGLSRSVDLKILKLALSKNECGKYNLPSMPGCSTHTDHPTELHALEAVVPGYLRKKLEKRINKYFDSSLFIDTEKQTDESVSRLIVKINRMIDDNQDIHEALGEIESRMRRG